MASERSHEDDTTLDLGAMLGAVLVKLPRIVLVTVLLLAATYAVLLFVPRMYESAAGILVEPRANAYTRAANEQPTSLTGNEAGVVSSQIELIKSRDTLRQVIDAENLRSVPEFNGAGANSPLDWIARLLGRSDGTRSIDNTVMSNLLDRMSVIQERDSRIISIIVRSTDPELAARLANAIANAHVQRRAQLSLSDTAEASQWLEEEIEKLRLRVQEAESRVANFRVDNDLFEGPNNTSLLDQQLSNLATQITTAQERKSSAESRAALIRGLIERGQPIEGVPDVRNSVVIQQLSEAKANLQGERAQKMATLLPNHPTVQSLAAQIRELDRQISTEGRGVATALDAQAEIEAQLLSSLESEMTRLKGTASTATRDTVQLQDLQREAKAQRDLLESYLLRYRDAVSRSESSSAFPDVRVVTVASSSVIPASPKTALILLAVGLVSVAVQVGGVLTGELMSGRALRERAPNWRRVQPAADRMPEEAFVELADGSPAAPAEGHGISQPPPVPLDAPKSGTVVVAEDAMHPTGREIEDEDTSVRPVTHSAISPVGQAPQPAPELAAASDFIRKLAVEAESVQPDRVAPTAAVVEGRAVATEDPQADRLEVAARRDQGPNRELSAVAALPPEADAFALGDLSADLSLGRAKIVMLASLGSQKDASLVAAQLVADAVRRGLSIVRVDAGSWRPTPEAGLTDLSTGDASFGEVVHKSSTEGLADVPWGHLPALDRRSPKPLTLVEALADIYEVVLVLTGRIGMASSLPMFAGLDCRVVLVTGARGDSGLVETAKSDARSLGFEMVQVVAAPQPQTEVA